MSFQRIPIAFSFGREMYDKGPRSTQIKEDALLTFTALSDINSKIKCGNIYSVKDPLENIINVYNQNVKYINNSIAHQVSFQERSYEEYCAQFHSKPSYESYQHDESIRQHGLLTRMDEEGQITQLGYLFSKLAGKITRTINRFNSVESALPKFSNFELILPQNRYDHDLFAPRLRKIEVPAEAPKVTIEKPVKATEIQEPTTLTTPTPPSPIETIDAPAAPVPPKIDVSVLCNLSDGKTLAICCDPTWAEQPTAFTPCESGWKGPVPVNQDWKFVILQGEKIISWEQGKNRRCNDQTQAFTIKANEIRFG